MVKKKSIVIVVIILFSIIMINASTFDFAGEEIFNFPQLNADLLQGHPASFFMPLNTSVFGDFDFNGGWENDGLSIIDGDIYAQTGFFYNITTLDVTKQNLTILEDAYFNGNLRVDKSISLEFGDLISEQNPDGADAIRIKATSSDVDIILGHGTGYFSIWNVLDNNAVFYVNNLGSTDMIGDLTVGGTIINTDFTTLTDNSIANALHRHSELVASDGSPDPALSVDATGNVGIGTTSPGAKLDVVGATNVDNWVRSIGSGTGRGVFAALSTGTGEAGYYFDAANGDLSGSDYGFVGQKDDGNVELTNYNSTASLYLKTSNTKRLTILSGGNVGIGTTSPDAKLDILAQETTDTVFLRAGKAGASTENMFFGLNVGGDNNAFIGSAYAGSGNRFGIRVGGTTSASEYLSVLQTGNVGIGTTSPDYKLQVNGIIAPETTSIFDLGTFILRWLKGWFVDLDVSNNVSIGGNLTVSGTFINPDFFIPQYVFAHTNENISILGDSIWTNITFTEEETDIKFGIEHTHNDDTNNTFTITEDGIYSIFYDYDVIDFSVGASTIDVAGRTIYVNGTEIDGSVFETDVVKQEIEAEITHNFLARFYSGEQIIFQFIADDEDVSISTHGTFGNHPDSVTINMRKIANL